MTSSDDLDAIARQLGRPPRALAGVTKRCPHGRPAVVEQQAYLDSGEPFPTTFYLTCPAAVAAISRLEAAGGVARYEALVASDADAAVAYREGAAMQRSLRRRARTMADGGASLALGIGGTARPGAVKCLHAHGAFALARPGYALGKRIVDEAGPLFPSRCCTP
jgi:hypothetical protein